MLSKSMDWFPYDNGLRHERVNLPLTAFGCYNTMSGLLFTYLINKPFSHELRILNYDGI